VGKSTVAAQSHFMEGFDILVEAQFSSLEMIHPRETSHKMVGITKLRILGPHPPVKPEFYPIHVEGTLCTDPGLPNKDGYTKWPCLEGVPRHQKNFDPVHPILQLTSKDLV
jgi:hypothetical protein